jgi:D-alanyl-D-alanine carboxypeptidase
MFFLNINNKFILGIFLLINSLFAETKHSYIVLDANTKEILKEENSTTKQGIASLTKIWTALIVLENSKLDDEVIISKNAS